MVKVIPFIRGDQMTQHPVRVVEYLLRLLDVSQGKTALFLIPFQLSLILLFYCTFRYFHVRPELYFEISIPLALSREVLSLYFV